MISSLLLLTILPGCYTAPTVPGLPQAARSQVPPCSTLLPDTDGTASLAVYQNSGHALILADKAHVYVWGSSPLGLMHFPEAGPEAIKLALAAMSDLQEIYRDAASCSGIMRGSVVAAFRLDGQWRAVVWSAGHTEELLQLRDLRAPFIPSSLRSLSALGSDDNLKPSMERQTVVFAATKNDAGCKQVSPALGTRLADKAGGRWETNLTLDEIDSMMGMKPCVLIDGISHEVSLVPRSPLHHELEVFLPEFKIALPHNPYGVR